MYIPTHSKRLRTAMRTMIFMLAICLCACGGGGRNEAVTGGVAFQAVWPESTQNAYSRPSGFTGDTGDVCQTFGITTIAAKVIDRSGVEVASETWPCDQEEHRGAIKGIDPGHGYRVVVEGLVAEDVAWRGEAADISIEAGRTSTVGRVNMYSLDFVLLAAASDGGRIEPAGRVAASEVSVQTFTFIANSGYEVEDVAVDGVWQGPIDSFTFSNISADRTIYVSFEPESGGAVAHIINAYSGGGGVIVPEGLIRTVDGNDQTFHFLPHGGSQVANVFVDGISQGAISSYTFDNVAADHAIRVAFDSSSYTITASASPGGQIDPPGERVVAYGETPSFSMTAEAGYYLSALTVGGQSIEPQDSYVFPPVIDNNTIHAVFAPVWYVDAGAQDGGDGRTWQRAFQTLDAAILQASAGDEIWIREGSYALPEQVAINKQVAIYGGFNGTEVYRHQRDWRDRPTVFIESLNQSRYFYITASASLDGLVFQNANISGSAHGDLQGGAMFVAGGAPTIANCTFLGNEIAAYNTCFGGAVAGAESSPEFDNCLFEENILGCESSTGAAMYFENCDVTIRNCRFIKNDVNSWGDNGSGGAIDIVGGAVTIEKSEFYKNQVSAGDSWGGAISSRNAALRVYDSYFIENNASGSTVGQGGAVDISKSVTGNDTIVFQNTVFLRNAARGSVQSAHGGAIQIGNASPTILNCTFSGNLTTGVEASRGGAICNDSGSPQIINTILWANGAYIDVDGTISDGEGMQVYDPSSLVKVSFSNIDQDGYSGSDNMREAPKLDRYGHLLAGSACIDRANPLSAPDSDVDGEPRSQSGPSDVGADEYLDSDGDGMPDFWETRFNLNNGNNDAGDDLDGDGLSNLDEYMAGLDPSADNPWSPALHLGWYDHTGFHDSSNDAAICGKDDDREFRSYFIFDLEGINDRVAEAVLRLEVVGVRTIRQAESFNVVHVATDPDDVEASGSSQRNIFTDLADGTRYAEEVVVSPDDTGTVINIHLSREAIGYINDRRGQQFVVGVADIEYSTDHRDTIIFSNGAEVRTHQLVLIME